LIKSASLKIRSTNRGIGEYDAIRSLPGRTIRTGISNLNRILPIRSVVVARLGGVHPCSAAPAEKAISPDLSGTGVIGVGIEPVFEPGIVIVEVVVQAVYDVSVLRPELRGVSKRPDRCKALSDFQDFLQVRL